MASFLFYCKPDSVTDPVDYLASNQIRGRVRSGDELWGVTLKDGALVLQAHVAVASIEDRAAAERLLGHSDLWDAEVFAIAESAESRADIPITDIAQELRFEGGVERLPEEWTGQSLRTMRRLTDVSAATLREIWESEASQALDVEALAYGDDYEDAGASEGRENRRLHRARERNRALVKRKKEQVRAAGRPLACEACGFDFGATYGAIGEDYIECHHVNQLSVVGESRTRLTDLALVCSNCHRMIHHNGGCLSVEAIRQLVRPPEG